MNENKNRKTEEWMVPWQKKLVEDESLVWERKIFKKTDGYWVDYNGGKMLGRMLDIPEIPAGATIEKDAWDHEHCELCGEKIAEYEGCQHEGYTNGKDWLCEKCYKEYIE